MASSPIVNTLKRLELIDEAGASALSNVDGGIDQLIQAIETNLVSGDELAVKFSHSFGSPVCKITDIDVAALPLDLIDLSLIDKHLVMPVYKKESLLFVAIADPTDPSGIDKIKFNTGLKVTTVQCNPMDLKRLAIIVRSEQSGSLDDFLIDGESELHIQDEEDDSENIDEIEESAPIVQFVNHILIDSINKGASDIHIEPFEKKLRIRFRIDGVLHNIASQPVVLAPQIIARVKILAKLDIAEKRAPQDGRIKATRL